MKIHSIEFSEDSKLCVIEEYAFMLSKLKEITILLSLIKSSERWCDKYDALVHSLETIKIRLRLLLSLNQSHFTTSNLIV